MTPTARRELLARHARGTNIAWYANGVRTGPGPAECESAALLICERSADADEARDLLGMVGVMVPPGAKVPPPHIQAFGAGAVRSAPKRDAHKKRGRAK